MTFENDDFFFFWFVVSSRGTHELLLEFFSDSSFFHIPNDCQMVDIDFFSNFSCSCKRIRFYDPLSWSLSTSDGQPLSFSSSRLLSPLQNFLSYHCTVCSLAIPGPNALLMLLYDPFWTQKIPWICFLSNTNP